MFKASEVPRLRHEMVEMWKSRVGWVCASVESTRSEATALNEGDAHGIAERVAAQVLLLNKSKLYWASTEMCSLLQSAANSLPPSVIEPSDLPSPFGFCVFETPIKARDTDDPERELQLSAMAWGLVSHVTSERKLIHLEFYAITPENEKHLLGADLWFLGASSWPIGVAADNFDIYPSHNATARASLLEDRLLLHALGLLIEQKATEVRTYEPARKKQRQARGKYDPKPVTVIDVRRVARREASGEHREVAWSHQWAVEGHWRRQWYPSQGRHYPKYIFPFIKGPADRPFLPKEKVRAVK